jgi:UDP-glucose:(heptosyl)LPS alpha-1,3-glucosyltransferase
LKAVIVNSNMVADDLMRHYNFPRERIHLVPNGIDLKRFSLIARERHRTEVRQQLGIPASAPVVLFVGSGFDRKGLARAIESVASQTGVPHLVVVGRDRRPAAFKARAERAGLAGRFHLVGPVKDPVPYYGAADALILPTIYDPFPSTVLEALACGLPVVTTTGCGAREVAKELDPALVCDAYDADALDTGLQRALAMAGNPDIKEVANRLASNYGIDRMIDRTLEIYDEFFPDMRARS